MTDSEILGVKMNEVWRGVKMGRREKEVSVMMSDWLMAQRVVIFAD